MDNVRKTVLGYIKSIYELFGIRTAKFNQTKKKPKHSQRSSFGYANSTMHVFFLHELIGFNAIHLLLTNWHAQGVLDAVMALYLGISIPPISLSLRCTLSGLMSGIGDPNSLGRHVLETVIPLAAALCIALTCPQVNSLPTSRPPRFFSVFNDQLSSRARVSLMKTVCVPWSLLCDGLRSECVVKIFSEAGTSACPCQ